MKRRGVSLLTFVVIAGLIVYAIFALSNMRAKLNEADKSRSELEQRAAEIQEENADLQYAIDHQEDPDTIEDIAREKLGLVNPDERIYYDSGD